MEGELLKWTNYVFGWRERYFVLKGSVLLYFIRRGEKAKGKIHLSVSTINVTNNDYRFEIDTGTTIFYLRATTKEKKIEWVKSIKLAKFESESKMNNIGNNIISSSRISNGDNIDMDNNRFSFIPDDKLTKKISFIKSLTENLSKLNLDLENFLKQNKQNFGSEYHSYLNDFLSTYKVI